MAVYLIAGFLLAELSFAVPAATACCSAARPHGRAEYGLLRNDSGWGISGEEQYLPQILFMVYQEIFCRYLILDKQ